MMIKAIATAIALAIVPISAAAMEEDAFTQAMREARSNNPHQEIARLHLLIAGGELTHDQHVQALSRIALYYGTTADDKPAAVAAYEEVIAMAPDHRLGVLAVERRDYANTQLSHIRRRLQSGPVTAEDLRANGEWDRVKDYLGTNGFMLTEVDARAMYYAGYFCEPGPHLIGSQNTERRAVGPCPEKGDPLYIDGLKILPMPPQ
ncbi:MAG: hypothetical protein ACK46Q_02745 [Hyphomonas sp.]